jgi:nucleotide-binding universal stress UspA family protein
VPKRVSPLTRALLAYDASPKAQEALYIATYLAGKWAMPLVVLTIHEDASLSNAQNKAREYLESQGIQAEYEAVQGPVAASILVVAEEFHCDWVIMGGYGAAPVVNFMLDNVVDQVLRSSGRPMLLCR